MRRARRVNDTKRLCHSTICPKHSAKRRNECHSFRPEADRTHNCLLWHRERGSVECYLKKVETERRKFSANHVLFHGHQRVRRGQDLRFDAQDVTPRIILLSDKHNLSRHVTKCAIRIERRGTTRRLPTCPSPSPASKSDKRRAGRVSSPARRPYAAFSTAYRRSASPCAAHDPLSVL